LGIGGPARFFAEASTEEHICEGLEFARKRNCPVFILGGGSNVVISDEGFDGLVLRITVTGIRGSDQPGNGDIVAAAGEEWDPFVRICVERCLAGIECLSGIPGRVGGTPIQNVGAYGQEVSEVVASVRTLDRETCSIVEFCNSECGFGYRTSIFNTTLRQRYVILSVAFSLRSFGEPCTRYADLQRYFTGRPVTPSLADVRNAVLEIRGAKAMVLLPGDPDSRSAGSFFKNPVVEPARARAIEEAARRRGALQGPAQLPCYRMPDGNLKIPAAWLIERAGFTRGYARGQAAISSKHTLALVNRGGATARELVALAREIREGVRAAFGVELVPEPVFVGFCTPDPGGSFPNSLE
jgi:UDP-N-acetylmuramate dehydrogenase